MARKKRMPRLPKLLDRKIYKTGQTRGADDDVIFQNRVSRSSTVLVQYEHIGNQTICYEDDTTFESGYIVLIRPTDYFGILNVTQKLSNEGLKLGDNALVFYQRRSDWETNDPDALGWKTPVQRTVPVGGQYVARVAATTAINGGEKISRGFNTTGLKGAGIRLFEYAPQPVIQACRVQLEAIFWLCYDAETTVSQFGLSDGEVEERRQHAYQIAQNEGLLDNDRLVTARLTDESGVTICPFCLERLSAIGFFNRMVQAEGREVHDITVTEINLFHISELRYGVFNHRPYNLGWGHHHCNVVVKDTGIDETIRWMDSIVKRNINRGLYKRAD